MEPIFLAKLFGLYFLVVGAIVLLRQSTVMPAIAEIAKNRALMYIIALVELAAGLAVIIAYPDVSYDWMGVISLVGWMLTVEGVLYLALPHAKVQKFVKSFNTPSWYLSGGVLSIVLGAYLAGVGFGLV